MTQRSSRPGATHLDDAPRPPSPDHRADRGPSLARRLVNAACGLLVATGAVVAVGGLIGASGPAAALTWLVVGVGAGHLAVGAWIALTDTFRLAEFSRAGAWTSTFVVLNGLVATSPELYYRVLVVLAALSLVSLRLLDAESPSPAGPVP